MNVEHTLTILGVPQQVPDTQRLVLDPADTPWAPVLGMSLWQDPGMHRSSPAP